MLAEVESLLVVQDRDRKIRQIDQELANIPLEEEELKEKLREDEEIVAKVKGLLQENEVEVKKIELDIQTRRDSIAKLKVQQYETKKNEEFQRMGEEIVSYEKSITKLEDEELELMEKGEAIQERLDRATEALKKTTEMVDEDVEDLERSKANFEKERGEMEANRADYATKIDEDLLDTYDRLMKGKNGLAVVGLVDEVCQGCHMKVIKSTVVEVKAENQIAHCENCGRILYWWTDETDRVVARYE